MGCDEWICGKKINVNVAGKNTISVTGHRANVSKSVKTGLLNTTNFTVWRFYFRRMIDGITERRNQ